MTQYSRKIDNNTTKSSSSKETAAGSSSSTITTIHTQPGVCLFNPQDLEAIRIAYKGCVGQELTATVAGYIEKCMAAGMHADVVLDAIERTGWARRPSPFYLRAILRRYLEWSIFTMEDVREDDWGLEESKKMHGDDAWKSWYKG